VSLSPFKAWIDNWEMTGLAPSAEDLVSKVRLRASDQAFSYDLELDAKGPITPQGEGGYSVKSATGQASRYYSQPFYSVSGEIRIGAKSIRVSGQAWLDREWSSQPLAETQTGWDWFSLHLETGEKLMGFRLRDSGEGYTSGTWIAPDGAPSPLQPGDFQATPLRWVEVAGRRMPVEWRVRLPSRGLDIRTRPLNAEAWMALTVPYWEGPIRFEGTHPGRGYLEMTGYP
jgi:predicted secreted hydrolase